MERAFPNFWGGLRAVRPGELMSAAERGNSAKQFLHNRTQLTRS